MIDGKKLIDELKQSGIIADNEYGNTLVDMINQQSQIGGWIACSERLPEEPVPETFQGLAEMDNYPEYIVTIKGATESTVLKYAGNGEWYGDGVFYAVTAWRPLPEPYKID